MTTIIGVLAVLGMLTTAVAAAQPTPSAPTTAPSDRAASPQKVSTAPLDLAGLEQRLRATKAIGVLTKLSLKNQVDDLLEQFTEFHRGRGGVTLDDLREHYNLLLMKVLSLLQKNDPPLARDLSASREAIWTVLADPVAFSNAARGG